MIEVYKDVINLEGYYQVSNLGNVRSLDRITNTKYKRLSKGQLLKPLLTQWGYYCVNLKKSQITTHWLIHRLVAYHFHDNPNNKTQVNHIDGNKFNNRADNLEWVTPSENQLHAHRTGLNHSNLKSNFGSTNVNCKLTIIIADEIRELYKSKLYTQAKLAELYKVNQQTIWSIINNKTWNHEKYSY